MKKGDLNFKEGNPGAVQYGNFINYYEFHPPDNRLKLLPKHIWNKNREFHGLDVGCNSGDLTVSLCNYLDINSKLNCNFLGIDIDPILIERAKEKNTSQPNLVFECVDFMQQSEKELIRQYLENNSLQKFSAVFCFSITMWIHLNHGDNGLKKFLTDVTALGELIIIEPQPWKCYKGALKRMKNSGDTFPLFKDLKIRNDVETAIEQFLLENCNVIKVYESERTQWGRKLLIFQTN